MKIDAAVLQAAATLAAAKLQIQETYRRDGRYVPKQGSEYMSTEAYLDESIAEVLRVLDAARAQ
jgi:hypothetical protein